MSSSAMRLEVLSGELLGVVLVPRWDARSLRVLLVLIVFFGFSL
jgi:hypothetical protein